MNKTKKIINSLAALSGEITVRAVKEVNQEDGCTCIEIEVDHVIHTRPCPHCGSKKHKKYGKKPSSAWHIPQGASWMRLSLMMPPSGKTAPNQQNISYRASSWRKTIFLMNAGIISVCLRSMALNTKASQAPYKPL